MPRNGFAVLNADDPLVRAMRSRCSGRISWFSMAEPGTEIRDMIDDHCRRGGRAVVLEHSELGDMIVIKQGRRSMQLAWTHLLPATFGGRATMNVQNAWPPPPRRSPPAPRCTTSGRACGPSPPTTTWRPDG